MIKIFINSKQDSWYDYIGYNKLFKIRLRIVVTDQATHNLVLPDLKITIKKQGVTCYYHQLFNVTQK